MTDTNDVATEVLDVGQLDKISRRRGWELEGEDGLLTARSQTKHEDIPEELMSTLAEEIGDGLAKVTVGAELAHSKDYGCKAQAFVSISVHCNNDDETIDRVQSHLHDMARRYANEDLVDMVEDRDRYMTEAATKKPEGKLARTKGKAPSPGVKPTNKVRARPAYRR